MTFLMAHGHAIVTWIQDYIMLTRIHIFDPILFKKSLFVFVPLLIARAVTNFDTIIRGVNPVQISPTICNPGYSMEITGRQNIIKAITYFLEACLLIYLVFRHLKSLPRSENLARLFLLKTVAVCVFSVVVSTTMCFILLLGIAPQHVFLWYAFINTTMSLSDSFISQSITEAFVKKNVNKHTTAVTATEASKSQKTMLKDVENQFD
ncbi:hypothetical protein BKA69DRAFT_1126225 [Paraphysoderma sedebokerense]|nr:hypothetical protein BKA69DRAFT_1126225 [Paraphysoderma sedebokerense]